MPRLKSDKRRSVWVSPIMPARRPRGTPLTKPLHCQEPPRISIELSNSFAEEPPLGSAWVPRQSAGDAVLQQAVPCLIGTVFSHGPSWQERVSCFSMLKSHQYFAVHQQAHVEHGECAGRLSTWVPSAGLKTHPHEVNKTECHMESQGRPLTGRFQLFQAHLRGSTSSVN